jgi:hypothetical protein
LGQREFKFALQLAQVVGNMVETDIQPASKKPYSKARLAVQSNTIVLTLKIAGQAPSERILGVLEQTCILYLRKRALGCKGGELLPRG